MLKSPQAHYPGEKLVLGWGAQRLRWVPGHQCGTRGRLFLITSWVGFSLISLGLSLEEPWGSCLRDEGRWEEG